MENRERDFPFGSEEHGLAGETENEEDQGFGLDRKKLDDADRKKVFLCIAIAAVIFVISLIIWPLDTSNLYRTNEAVRMFTEGLLNLNPRQIGWGLVMILKCMLYELKDLGRAFLLVAVIFIIIRLTVLRKKKPKE